MVVQVTLRDCLVGPPAYADTFRLMWVLAGGAMWWAPTRMPSWLDNQGCDGPRENDFASSSAWNHFIRDKLISFSFDLKPHL